MTSQITQEIKDSVIKESYLIFKDHRSDQNWIYNEASWEHLPEKEQIWWKTFVDTILHKVSLEIKNKKPT